MEYYLPVRHLHMLLAALSGALFCWRGLLMLRQSPQLQLRIYRIAPHLIDSGLLAAALYLAIVSGQSPGNSPWLLAKIIALLAYIGLGMVALKRGKTQTQRALAFAAAILTYAYIVGVALSKSPTLVWW
jgi:uncharacterized membrane protein SirB2